MIKLEVQSLGDRVVHQLLDHLLTDEHEIVTLITGEGSTDAETRKVILWLEEHHEGVEAETHHGGQPLYPYFVGIE